MASDRRIARDELLAAIRQFRLATPPKLGDASDLVSDADVDLFEEDAYLAGLIDQAVARGRIDVGSIFLDETIDQRLQEALKARPDDSRLRAMREYRMAMKEVAGVLAAAMGVSVRGLD